MNRIRIIDYLKTLAIVGVVLYHCGLIKNGYLGVEVFFVISGFLMIGKVGRQISEGAFKPINYIVGRVSGFWPLIAVSGVFSLVIGYFLMLPDDYENLAESVIASNFFLNNVLQAITTKNYWDIVNTYKPLMHTWYIGVLVQVIIFLSIIFWLTDKKFKKNIKAVLLIITVVSFVGFCLPFFSDSDKFYYFPFRLFEVTIGCLIPYFPSSTATKKKNILIGSLALSIAFFVMFAGYDIPGFAGKIIVLITTCLVLWSQNGINEDYGIPEKVYSVVTIPGKHSYDIYIWHQIVIAFLYYSVFQELEPLLVLMVIVITAVLTICTIQLRKRIPFLSLKWSRIVLSIVFAALGCVVSAFLYLHAGVVRDVPELGVDTENVHRNMHAEYCDIPYSWNKDFEDSDKVHVLVLGNSFGRDFANILNESVYSDQIEISYLYGADASSEEDRVMQADFVFYGADGWGVPDKLSVIPENKLYIVGNKNYGKSNGIIYKNRNKDWYTEQSVKLSSEMILRNNSLKGIYGDHYIDMITPLITDGRIKVFTDDGYFISQDCRHLTKHGAQYYSRILDLAFLLNE